MTPEVNINPANDSLSDSATGIMAVVVGPSGAGKDTLMNLAARHFAGRPDVHFVRRVITREGMPATRITEAFPKPISTPWSRPALSPSPGRRMA